MHKVGPLQILACHHAQDFLSYVCAVPQFQIAEMLLQQLHTTLSCSKQIHFHSLWLLGYRVRRSLSLSLLQCWTCLWKGPQMGSGVWQCVDSCLLGKQRPVVIGMHWPHSRCWYWVIIHLWMPAPHSARATIWCKTGLWRSKASLNLFSTCHILQQVWRCLKLAF